MKRFAFLAVVLAAIVVPAPAFGSDAYTCQMSGFGNIAAPGVQSVLTDATDLNALDTDTGSFTFTGSATCVHADSDAADTANTGVGSVLLNGSGTYVNTVCGTGTADGTISISALSNSVGSQETPGSALFHIQFASGEGALTISRFANSQRTGGSGAGEVTIVPSVGNCVNTDVLQFSVEGAFAATV